MKTRQLFAIFGLIFLTAMLAACGGRPGAPVAATAVPDDEPATETNAEPTATRPSQSGVTILADGSVVAVKPVLAVSFTASGRLLELAVQPGDVVAAGDLIATLDDEALLDAVTNAEFQAAQSELNLTQAQAELDRLLTWEPDETAVALAQANLTAAQAQLENAQVSDSVAGNSVTQANVSVAQAERQLADAQEAYNTAFDPGREWELGDPFRKQFLENERDAATRNLQFAEENLRVARANYSLAVAGINNDSSLNAEASVISAQQALENAQKPPTAEQIEAAQLSVEQAELSLQQSQLSLEQAQEAVADAQLLAPAAGTILSVEVAEGAMIGAGSPIVTMLDTTQLEFHTSNLSERDLARVAPGQTVQVTLKAYPNDVIEGMVVRIGTQATGTVGDAAVFPVIVSISSDELDIRPGMTGRAEIAGE
ncbi:MAG: HlyD family efflux transporter periplasmic adaptor subunit [Ardenticatenaceae bacterium]|nr:HlyD family efflux transporter periplasmic adaptor subunit [Ardenticatenaceae bacterium]